MVMSKDKPIGVKKNGISLHRAAHGKIRSKPWYKQ